MTTVLSKSTVGLYLLDKLCSNGVKHIFGVPGDYVLRLDKLIEEHQIKFINATRENTAGYMADAYARIRGLGAACITYGVGINIVNATAQAYVESSPLIIISGAAGTDELISSHQLHHLINKSATAHLENTQLDIFKHITVAQAVLDDPETAAEEIDRVLNACLLHKKPVYIELPRNIVDLPIRQTDVRTFSTNINDEKALQEALEELSGTLKNSKQPLLWIGHEIQRYGLAADLIKFAENFHIPIVSSLLGKTTINEHHPLFVGVYQGELSRPEVQKFVNDCDCALIFGVILSDIDTGIFTAKLNHDRRIIAGSDTLQVGQHHFHNINFSDFIHKLPDISLKVHFQHTYPANIDRKISPFIPKQHQKITTERVFNCIQSHLSEEHIVTTDIGDCMLGSIDFTLEQNSFIACAYFGSLGFGTPCAIGTQIADPKRRVIGIVGDGGFQMTGMELSTAVKYDLNPIIIVLNNHGYGTERPLLEGKYNDILNWNYAMIPEVLGGGVGIRVETEEEFEHALKAALSQRKKFYLIEIELGKTDFSAAMQRFSALINRKKMIKTKGTATS